MTVFKVSQDFTEKNIQEINDFYKDILDGIINGVWVTDKHDTIFYTNKGMEKIAGIPSNQINGARVLKDFPESTLNYFRPYYLKAKKKLTPIYYDAIPVVTPSGRQSYQSGWLIPRIRDNSFDGMICTVNDITNQKKIEQKLIDYQKNFEHLNEELEKRIEERTSELRESEMKFRTLFEEALNPILITDDNGFYVEVNKAATKFLECEKDEIIGKSVFNYAPPEKLDQQKIEHSPLYSSRSLETEYFVNNRIKTTLLNIVPFQISEKKYLFGVAQDITKRKEVEDALRVERDNIINILNSMKDGVYIVNTQYDIEFINPTILRDFGSYKGKKCFEYIHDRKAPCLRYKIPDILKGITVRSEWHCNKTNRIYDVIETPLKKLDGSVFKLKIIRDITDLKGIEIALQESEKKYSTLARLSPVGIFHTDRDGNCLFVNDRWCEIAGLVFNEAMGTGWHKGLHPDDRERLFTEWYDAVKNNLLFESEYRFQRPDGRVTWVIGQALQITDDSGDASGYVGTITDITELKNAEEKLKESQKKYRDAYNQAEFYKDVFMHDINNILQVIRSGTELTSLHLKSPEKLNDIQEINEIVEDQIRKGVKLISTVQKLSQLEESEFILNSVDAYFILNDAIEYVYRSYKSRNLSINVDVLNKEIRVQGNNLLLDVFENVLINSIKYNENSNVEISIKISRVQKNVTYYYKFEFRDNGIGIKDLKKKRIFQRGFKEHKGGKGMGLGLSLVKKILNSYNGEIWVEDRVKGDYTKGSNFIILIPAVN